MKKLHEIEIEDVIIPDKAIYRHLLYDLIVPHKYVIFGYKIITLNELILLVKLESTHPNCDENGNFCLPPLILNKKFTSNIKNTLNSMLGCFNLDNCYFIPYDVTLSRKES